MKQIKTLLLGLMLSTTFTVTSSLANNNQQTSCIPADKVPVPALLSAIAIEKLSMNTINTFKKIVRNPQLQPWPTIYKRGYELAASWEYNIKVLNSRLPTTPSKENKHYYSLTIMKYCPIGQVITPELSTQIDTIGDLGILKTGVDFVHHFYPHVSDKELFTSKQYQARVLAILIYWGSLQEYAVENIQDDNMWLYTLKYPQETINPVFSYKVFGDKTPLTVLPQANWFYWPIYFYKQAQQVFLQQPANSDKTQSIQPVQNDSVLSPKMITLFDRLHHSSSFQQLSAITQRIDINHPQDPALDLAIENWLINFAHNPLINQFISTSKHKLTVNKEENPQVLMSLLKKMTANLSAKWITPDSQQLTHATILELEQDNNTDTIINSLQDPACQFQTKLHISCISHALGHMHDGVFTPAHISDHYMQDLGKTFDQIMWN